MDSLLTLIQHHRIHDFTVQHGRYKIPVIRRFDNFPEIISLCLQIRAVLHQKECFPITVLLLGIIAFREEYNHPPLPFSIDYIKDTFYHWLVAKLQTPSKERYYRCKLTWIIFLTLHKKRLS